MIQTLSENDFPPTHIVLKSIENYSKVSTKQQMQMSKVLSSVVAGTATKTSSYETAIPAISLSISESQQSMALFSGAFIQDGNFSININTVNQSPKLTLEESSPPEALSRWKSKNSDDE